MTHSLLRIHTNRFSCRRVWMYSVCIRFSSVYQFTHALRLCYINTKKPNETRDDKIKAIYLNEIVVIRFFFVFLPQYFFVCVSCFVVLTKQYNVQEKNLKKRRAFLCIKIYHLFDSITSTKCNHLLRIHQVSGWGLLIMKITSKQQLEWQLSSSQLVHIGQRYCNRLYQNNIHNFAKDDWSHSLVSTAHSNMLVERKV